MSADFVTADVMLYWPCSIYQNFELPRESLVLQSEQMHAHESLCSLMIMLDKSLRSIHLHLLNFIW
jgi:hypothetical protein